VREDDAEPELLDDEGQALEEGAVVAMAVKDSPPLLWRTFPEECVELSEGGTVATQIRVQDIGDLILVITRTELTEGRHYWEVELLSEDIVNIYVGVARPNLDPVGDYAVAECTDAWCTETYEGDLWGDGAPDGDFAAGGYKKGDRVGVLLDLNNGSLLFFKNGVQHGSGYPAGSVTGPVVAALQMREVGEAVRLHAGVAFPAGHVQ
jgi:hypothetical protein